MNKILAIINLIVAIINFAKGEIGWGIYCLVLLLLIIFVDSLED